MNINTSSLPEYITSIMPDAHPHEHKEAQDRLTELIVFIASIAKPQLDLNEKKLQNDDGGNMQHAHLSNEAQ